MRLICPATAGLVFALGLSLPASATEDALPQMGSSAEELLSPQQEAEYGADTLFQLRRYGYVLDDPLIDSWLGTMGHRLGAASGQADQAFTFFMMRDREINAFATFGGYVGVNAGLVLTAESEDEVAGVLAHEISHVTQHHVLRAAERAQKDQVSLLLGELLLIAAAQKARGNGDNEAIAAAAVSAQALAVQRQINYTRASEAEADRIGLQTLYRSGYDVNGMANFFDRMSHAMRGNAGGDKLPAYLQDHPVTAVRISEARDRAAQLLRDAPPLQATQAPLNPLLPVGLSSRGDTPDAPLRMFDWARERLRVLSADNSAAALREYRTIMTTAGTKATDAQHYGLALAEMKAGSPAAADSELQALARSHPDNLWIGLALADAAHLAHNDAVARKRYEAMLQAHPNDRPVSLSYAGMLNDVGSAEDGRRAQAVLRPLLSESADDPVFQHRFARACELAGDVARAAEAYAESAFLNGRAEDALNQLNGLLKRDDVDYVQRARVEARIATITPVVLELRRQGIKPQNQREDDT